MDQSETSVTIVNATEDFLKSQIAQKDERIANLESHISTVTQRSYTESAERNRMRNEMQEWTLEAIENGTFDESTAQEIADICGFELTKEFEVEVTVMYSVTVLARDEESATNAIHDIDFDTVDYNSENISWLSSSIDRVDI
jgi:hypothetical protein